MSGAIFSHIIHFRRKVYENKLFHILYGSLLSSQNISYAYQSTKSFFNIVSLDAYYLNLYLFSTHESFQNVLWNLSIIVYCHNNNLLLIQNIYAEETRETNINKLFKSKLFIFNHGNHHYYEFRMIFYENHKVLNPTAYCQNNITTTGSELKIIV